MRRSLVAALFGAFLSAVVVAQQPATTGTPSPAAAASQPTAAQPTEDKVDVSRLTPKKHTTRR